MLAAYGALPMAKTPAATAAAAAGGAGGHLAAAPGNKAAAGSIMIKSGDETEAESEEEVEEEEAAMGEAAVDMEPMVDVEDPHTKWLLEQLQALVDTGADADDTQGLALAPGGLKGRRVAFALLEEMAIQGAKGSILKMPAGVYQVRWITT